MPYWKSTFILTALLYLWTKSEFYEVNPLITGFSTCYIELSLFNDKQDLRSPPEVPVVVTLYSKLTFPTKYENLTDNEKWSRCLEKKKLYSQTHNCLSIFLFSPRSIEEVQKTVFDRFSWIFQCRKDAILKHVEWRNTNYEKQTYVTVVNYAESYVHFGNIFSKWNTSIYFTVSGIQLIWQASTKF